MVIHSRFVSEKCHQEMPKFSIRTCFLSLPFHFHRSSLVTMMLRTALLLGLYTSIVAERRGTAATYSSQEQALFGRSSAEDYILGGTPTFFNDIKDDSSDIKQASTSQKETTKTDNVPPFRSFAPQAAFVKRKD